MVNFQVNNIRNKIEREREREKSTSLRASWFQKSSSSSISSSSSLFILFPLVGREVRSRNACASSSCSLEVSITGQDSVTQRINLLERTIQFQKCMNFAMFSSRLGLFSSSLLKTHTGLVFYRWVRIETKKKEESGRVLKWASSAYSLLKPIYEEIRHLGLVWKKTQNVAPPPVPV